MRTQDSWTHFLYNFYPYLGKTNIILKKFKRTNWLIEINGSNTEMFDWVENNLSKNPDVEKLKSDSWIFNNRKSAERFIILFNLKWAQ